MTEIIIQRTIDRFIVNHPELTDSAMDVVLSKMVDEGVITRQQAQDYLETSSAFGYGFEEKNPGYHIEEQRTDAISSGLPLIPDRMLSFDPTKRKGSGSNRYIGEKSLEAALRDANLDILSKEGLKIYKRLAELPQYVIDEINSTDLINLIKANPSYDALADCMEYNYGVVIRTKDEQVAWEKLKKTAWGEDYREKEIAYQIIANKFDNAIIMLKNYRDSQGILNIGWHREGMSEPLRVTAEWLGFESQNRNIHFNVTDVIQGLINAKADVLGQLEKGVHTNDSQFANAFYSITGRPFNSKMIGVFAEKISEKGEEEYISQLNKELFDLSDLDNTVQNTIANCGGDRAGDIALMLLGAEFIGKGVAATFGNGLKSLTAMKGGRIITPMILGGTTLGTWTAFQGSVNNVTKKAPVTNEDLKELGKATAQSFGFGAVGGLLQVVAVIPVMNLVDKPSKKVMQTILNMMEKDGEVTAADITKLCIQSGQNYSWIAKGAGFLTEVTGFTGYETAMDVIKDVCLNDNISFKDMTLEDFESYFGRKFGEQLTNLGSIKAMSALFMMMKGGQIGREYLINYDVQRAETLNNITVKPVEFNGKKVFEVSSKEGLSLKVENYEDIFPIITIMSALKKSENQDSTDDRVTVDTQEAKESEKTSVRDGVMVTTSNEHADEAVNQAKGEVKTETEVQPKKEYKSPVTEKRPLLPEADLMSGEKDTPLQSEEVKEPLSYAELIEQIESKLNEKFGSEDHYRYWNGCGLSYLAEHYGYEFVNDNFDLISRNLSCATAISPSNIEFFKLIDKNFRKLNEILGVEKTFDIIDAIDVMERPKQLQDLYIKNLEQDVKAIEDIVAKIERNEFLSDSEAELYISYTIFDYYGQKFNNITSILDCIRQENGISPQAIELIRKVKEVKGRTYNFEKDLLSTLSKFTKEGQLLTNEDIVNISEAINKYQSENISKQTDFNWFLEIARNSQGKIDAKNIVELMNKGIPVETINKIYVDSFIDGETGLNQSSCNYELFNKGLEVLKSITDLDKDVQIAIVKIFRDNKFENYEEFIKNPEESIQLINKLMEMGIVKKESIGSFAYYTSPLKGLKLPVREEQLEAFNVFLENGYEVGNYEITKLLQMIVSVDKVSLPLVKELAKKYAANMYASELSRIGDILLPEFCSRDDNFRSIIMTAVEKNVFGEHDYFSYDSRFMEVVKEYPDVVQKILSLGIRNPHWYNLREFINGGTNGAYQFKALSKEQLDFTLKLMEKTIDSEGYCGVYFEADINAVISELDPKLYDFIMKNLDNNMSVTDFMEKVNEAYKKNNNIIEEYEKFVKTNPKAKELIGSIRLIISDINKAQFFAEHEELLDGFSRDSEIDCRMFFEKHITLDAMEKALPELNKLSENAKKIPGAIPRTFVIATAVNSEMTGISANVLECFVRAYNKLVDYDQDFVSQIADTILNNFAENSNFEIHNLDYLNDYLKENPYDNDYVAKVLFTDIDMKNVEAYLKTLKLDESKRNEIIENILEIMYNSERAADMRLDDKMALYDRILNLDETTKSVFLRFNINTKVLESKLCAMLGTKRDVIATPPAKQQDFLREVLSNNNRRAEEILKTFDFGQYEKSGLPLKYSRNDFCKTVEALIKDLSPAEQLEVLNHFGLVRGANGFDGLPNNKPYDNPQTSQKVKQTADRVQSEIEKFTLRNEVQTGNPEIDKLFTSLIEGLPEFAIVVGKEQHGTHRYSVDIHTLKVLQSAMNHPLYSTLSDTDKTILKFAAILHDTGKKGGIVDKGHAGMSADFTASILEKYPFPQGVKDRILDIVENHHWFEAYNTGNASAQDVAVRCRRPEDFKIYEILSKADFENVNPEFHLKLSGTKTQAEFDKYMEDKMQDISDALKFLYSRANLIFDTKFVRRGMFFPRQTVEINGEAAELRVLDLNQLEDNASLQPYGFAKGVTKENARFMVHMTNPNRENMDPVTILTDNSLNESTWSTSLIKTSNNRTYCGRRFGFVLDVDQANISSAYYRNMGSGYEKGLKAFESLAFSTDKEARTYVRDKFVTKLKNRGIELTEEEYGILSKQLIGKKYISQINSDIQIGDKIIRAEVLRECLEESRDALFNGGDIHSEVIPINPRVIGLVAKVDKLEDCPSEFLQFAKDHDLPIILMSEQKELNPSTDEDL